MSRRRSDAYRMRRAVAEASQPHDGAYKDPMAIEMIARNHKVDLTELVRQTKEEVAERLARELAQLEDNEIEQLREIVGQYVDPNNVAPEHTALVMKCVMMLGNR